MTLEDDGDDGDEATKGTKKERVGRRKWSDDLWSRVTAGLVDHAKIKYELRKRTRRFLPAL